MATESIHISAKQLGILLTVMMVLQLILQFFVPVFAVKTDFERRLARVEIRQDSNFEEHDILTTALSSLTEDNKTAHNHISSQLSTMNGEISGLTGEIKVMNRVLFPNKELSYDSENKRSSNY